MPTRWLRACRGAVAFLGLVVLCTPVALATPPEETAPEAPVAAADPSPADVAVPPAGEPSPAAAEPAPADEPSPAAAEPAPADEPSPADVAGSPADDSSAPPAGDAAPADVAGSPADVAASPADDSSAPADGPPPPAGDPAPPGDVSSSPRTVAAARAAQPPPADEEPADDEPEPAVPEPVLPPATDPGCVFPQPDPALSEAECQVLASDCTVLGTEGPDILVGGATKDLICGLGGDDQIDGGDGDDAILGGDGNDRLTGGPGADCMFGQAGEDELVDPAEDDVAAIQDGEEVPPPDPETTEGRGVTREGACTVWAVKPVTQPPPEQQAGSVSGSVEAAGIVLELSQLINEASGDVPFPLDLPDTARAKDGIVRLLLECESTDVSGTLELLERRGRDTVLAGREDFECTPPSEVVEVELEPAAADRLEARGRLEVTVRVDAAEHDEDHDFRVTLRSEQ
jgi:hypothetical protein